MSVFGFLTFGIVLLVLQTSLLPLLPGWLGHPNPLFVLVVFASLRLETYQGAVLALLFGLLMDIISGLFLGLHPVIYLVLFFILKTLAKNLIIYDIHLVPLTLASYLFTTSGVFITASLLGPDSLLQWSWKSILLQLLVLAILTLPLFALYEFLLAKLNPPKRRSSLEINTSNRFRT